MTVVNGWLQNPDPLRILFIVLAGGAILALGLGISSVLLATTDPLRRRLADSGPEKRADGRLLLMIQTIAGPVAAWVLPTTEVERSRVSKQLTYAGFRQPEALQTCYAIKVVLMV